MQYMPKREGTESSWRAKAREYHDRKLFELEKWALQQANACRLAERKRYR